MNNDNSGTGKPVLHHSYSGEHYSPLTQPSCSDLLLQITSIDGKPDLNIDCPLSMNKNLEEIKSEKIVLKSE